MKDTNINGPAGRKLADAEAGIKDGIARARKLAAESKRLLERLSYGRLGPRPTPNRSR